ncbi:transcriptional regulator, LacI family [Pasteurella testudinis DSM 23072]|uniref:Transcriptional regulator, LacI family n=1 Tax=Pasteurella testudinis DSM 23072 TaxID=1122938 RepID=A0A1W1UEI0_9PAST|nr:LacI family DNA-binding transcriptional regulator [Pasteurella testudinis]SMB79477.1 transcriptional regulator, LacI family [Pasteurella testudinis DSM 23072]SUB50756.1 transcriptional regulator GntR [Pasteurella testudinis]
MSSNTPSTRTRRTTGRVTLADVAKQVGVGPMTVSRALRTPERVSESLRQKIESAVKQLGYVPNSAARALASLSSRNVVVVTSSLTSSENCLILSALQQSLKMQNLQLVILIANGTSWFKELINNAPAAIILLNLRCPPEERKWIENSTIPTIEIGIIQHQPLGINIGIDSRTAMQTLIPYLLKKGYRTIGLLSAMQDIAAFQQYLESWQSALLSRHISPHLVLHRPSEVNFSTGAALLNDALLEWGQIDACVFLSDELACGALCELARKHIAVPHDIAIVGMGGLDIGNVIHPRLTTLQIPYEKMGELAGKKLQALLQQEDTALSPEVISVPIKLLERSSA